ncbi:curli-like amyloid fiber formation chaperone CsgH [Hymenobacter edaphi]|uniref:CsgH-like domain-containing protein n=1 Tax=Hymenobacter edaphi TaxID=2211146 RepID=A0A328B9W8_9BACT|nr:curli-like amyloid fiber formation chaperone CsgH [Hymenobacter edaphi]RAK63485.1 hypothetical protein DLM85_20995 [Hymenobacter edaphi]
MLHASILTAAAVVACLTTAADAPRCQARLEVQRRGDNVTITGHCLNTGVPPAARWTYELRAEKQGRSGSSRNAQAGNFVAAPGQEVTLSRTTLNLGATDACRLRLRVLDEQGAVLAADSLLLPAAP